jgi:hypothetical protein
LIVLYVNGALQTSRIDSTDTRLLHVAPSRSDSPCHCNQVHYREFDRAAALGGAKEESGPCQYDARQASQQTRTTATAPGRAQQAARLNTLAYISQPPCYLWPPIPQWHTVCYTMHPIFIDHYLLMFFVPPIYRVWTIVSRTLIVL